MGRLRLLYGTIGFLERFRRKTTDNFSLKLTSKELMEEQLKNVVLCYKLITRICRGSSGDAVVAPPQIMQKNLIFKISIR